MAALVLLFVMVSITIVHQGHRYTIEHFGRLVRVASTSCQPSSTGSGARSTWWNRSAEAVATKSVSDAIAGGNTQAITYLIAQIYVEALGMFASSSNAMDQGRWWMIGGVLLLIAELLAPGFFLLFVGAAALITGAFVLLLDVGTAPALVMFAIHTALAVYLGRKVDANRPVSASAPHLNNRSAALIGRSAVAVGDIDEGGGRVRLGDGEWSARGGPAQPGERVEIIGVEGNCLIVEAAPKLPE